MLWLAGLFVAGTLVFALRRYAAFAGLLALAVHNVRPSLAVFENAGRIDHRIWFDPYMLGYIYGFAALTLSAAPGRRSPEGNAKIIRTMMIQLEPFLGRRAFHMATSLSVAEDPLFCKGLDHSSNVYGLTFNKLRPEIMGDPVVQNAVTAATHQDQWIPTEAAAQLESVYMADHWKANYAG